MFKKILLVTSLFLLFGIAANKSFAEIDRVETYYASWITENNTTVSGFIEVRGMENLCAGISYHGIADPKKILGALGVPENKRKLFYNIACDYEENLRLSFQFSNFNGKDNIYNLFDVKETEEAIKNHFSK